MNGTCKAGLILLILGILFIVLIGPLLGISGVFSINPGLAIIGGLLMWMGVMFIPIGFILAIVGAITSPKEHYIYSNNPQYQQLQYTTPIQQPTQPANYVCHECNTPVNHGQSFCNDCGTKFKW